MPAPAQEQVSWTDHSVVVCSILAPAIGFSHADNPHFVGAVSRRWQTRDRDCSTPDGTQLAADQVGRCFTPLLGARNRVDLTQSILLVVPVKVQFALATPKTTVTERIRIGRRAKKK